MKYAQTTVEFVLITLIAVVIAVVIANGLGLVDYAKRTIFSTTREGSEVVVPSMVH